MSFGSRVGSVIVQGFRALVWGSNRQAKSTKASVTMPSASVNCGGSIAGTPPPPAETGPTSHTAALPLPSGRLLSIHRSGRPAPAGPRLAPGNMPLAPVPPSMTMRNKPLPTEKTRRPCPSISGVGVGVSTQLELQQPVHPSTLLRTERTSTFGPCPVGVADGVAVRVAVHVGVPVLG